jgi:hypothetical protein
MNLTPSVQNCIQECLRCYQSCQSNAAGMCLNRVALTLRRSTCG